MATVDMIGRLVWTRIYSSDGSVLWEEFGSDGDGGRLGGKFSGTALYEINKGKFEISSS